MPSDNYAVELTAPDISAWRDGNTGIPFATTLESGRPGPHVMVAALTHGNEICGAIALDHLVKNAVRPARGRLTLACNNVEAYAAFDPRQPNASRFVDEDYNRVWDEATLDGPRTSRELTRARAMRPLVDTVDFLLDLHSMQHPTAPLMLAGLLPRSEALARQVGVPALVVRDAGHAAGRRLRDYGGFGDPAGHKTALLVECGQHWERRSADVAIATTLRFLLALDLLDAATLARLAPPPAEPQRVITVTDAVTIETDRFAFVDDYRGLEVIPKAGTLLARDGDRAILTPYDDCVLIMPSRRLRPGQTAVRLGRFTG